MSAKSLVALGHASAKLGPDVGRDSRFRRSVGQTLGAASSDMLVDVGHTLVKLCQVGQHPPNSATFGRFSSNFGQARPDVYPNVPMMANV